MSTEWRLFSPLGKVRSKFYKDLTLVKSRGGDNGSTKLNCSKKWTKRHYQSKENKKQYLTSHRGGLSTQLRD